MSKITITIDGTDENIEKIQKFISEIKEPKPNAKGWCQCKKPQWFSLGHRSECGKCGGKLE